MNNLEQEPTVVAPPTPLSPSIPLAQSLNSVTALARFEFEPERGNEGTKVMMVEWQDDDDARDKAGSWNVSWQGKSNLFPADDNPVDNIRRLYFLLPPGQIIPPHLTIAYIPPTAAAAAAATTTTPPKEQQPESLRMNVNPLPAIFTPELGATAKASGKKGVLHTIWAKKRLQVLEREITSEQEHNLEGIALEMATSEKEWIEQNFGLSNNTASPAAKKSAITLDMSHLKSSSMASPPQSPGGLQSPKSPGGRRLSEKLKGLSLGTSDRDLMTNTNNRAGGGGVNTPTRELHPLSPEVGDMAVSSFSAFRNAPPSAMAASTTSTTTTNNNTTQSQPQSQSQPQPQPKRIVAQAPPEFIRKQQQQQSSSISPSAANGPSSLNFVPQFHRQPSFNKMIQQQPSISSATTTTAYGISDDPDDLFAIALSPRSPSDPKSPFSIPSSEVGAFTQIKGSQEV